MLFRSSEYQKKYQVHINPTTYPVKIDGVLDEPCWQNSEVVTQFNKKYPNDFGEAKYKTWLANVQKNGAERQKAIQKSIDYVRSHRPELFS